MDMLSFCRHWKAAVLAVREESGPLAEEIDGEMNNPGQTNMRFSKAEIGRFARAVPVGIWIVLAVTAVVGSRWGWVVSRRPHHAKEIVSEWSSVGYFMLKGGPQPDSTGSRVAYAQTTEKGAGVFICDAVTGPSVVGYGSYNTCEDIDKGVQSCGSSSQFCYYGTTPCVASADYWGMAGCALALIALGAVDLGVCFTAGVWTGGTACYAALAASVGAGAAACRYCAIYDCAPASSGTTYTYVTQSSADSNSGQCPPQG
jgi:hypothetical protein